MHIYIYIYMVSNPSFALLIDYLLWIGHGENGPIHNSYGLGHQRDFRNQCDHARYRIYLYEFNIYSMMYWKEVTSQRKKLESSENHPSSFGVFSLTSYLESRPGRPGRHDKF